MENYLTSGEIAMNIKDALKSFSTMTHTTRQEFMIKKWRLVVTRNVSPYWFTRC